MLAKNFLVVRVLVTARSVMVELRLRCRDHFLNESVDALFVLARKIVTSIEVPPLYTVLSL